MQASAHSGFLQLRGTATVSRDKVRITELWNPIIKTWFTEGVDDPRITVIKVEPSEGYYRDKKHGNAVAGIKMLIGATIGRTMDDSIEGSPERLTRALQPVTLAAPALHGSAVRSPPAARVGARRGRLAPGTGRPPSSRGR